MLYDDFMYIWTFWSLLTSFKDYVIEFQKFAILTMLFDKVDEVDIFCVWEETEEKHVILEKFANHFNLAKIDWVIIK